MRCIEALISEPRWALLLWQLGQASLKEPIGLAIMDDIFAFAIQDDIQQPMHI